MGAFGSFRVAGSCVRANGLEIAGGKDRRFRACGAAKRNGRQTLSRRYVGQADKEPGAFAPASGRQSPGFRRGCHGNEPGAFAPDGPAKPTRSSALSRRHRERTGAFAPGWAEQAGRKPDKPANDDRFGQGLLVV